MWLFFVFQRLHHYPHWCHSWIVFNNRMEAIPSETKKSILNFRLNGWQTDGWTSKQTKRVWGGLGVSWLPLWLAPDAHKGGSFTMQSKAVTCTRLGQQWAVTASSTSDSLASSRPRATRAPATSQGPRQRYSKPTFHRNDDDVAVYYE